MAQLRDYVLRTVDLKTIAAGVNADTLEAAARSFKAKTAIGADGLGFNDIVHAPMKAKEDLARLVKSSILQVAWPRPEGCLLHR